MGAERTQRAADQRHHDGHRESARVRRAGRRARGTVGADRLPRAPRRQSSKSAAIPDFKPLDLPLPPADAFARALDAAKGMGWEIAATDAAAGRIEATATTPWFGFRDDVVIRVTPAPPGSRIDVRSVSRVGRSDLGTNAKRIRTFLDKLAHA